MIHGMILVAMHRGSCSDQWQLHGPLPHDTYGSSESTHITFLLDGYKTRSKFNAYANINPCLAINKIVPICLDKTKQNKTFAKTSSQCVEFNAYSYHMRRTFVGLHEVMQAIKWIKWNDLKSTKSKGLWD